MRERPVENVVGNHAVVDVHNPRGRIDVQDDALHRSDEVVARAKIRGERDDGIGQRQSPFQTSLAKNGTRARVFYSFCNLSEGNSRVKAACPSGYGK